MTIANCWRQRDSQFSQFITFGLILCDFLQCKGDTVVRSKNLVLYLQLTLCAVKLFFSKKNILHFSLFPIIYFTKDNTGNNLFFWVLKNKMYFFDLCSTIICFHSWKMKINGKLLFDRVCFYASIGYMLPKQHFDSYVSDQKQLND